MSIEMWEVRKLVTVVGNCKYDWANIRFSKETRQVIPIECSQMD